MTSSVQVFYLFSLTTAVVRLNRKSLSFDMSDLQFLCTFKLFTSTYSSGSFQLKLISFQNSLGLLQSGQCCSGTSGRECVELCATFFRLCLKQYQSVVDPEPPCTYGSRITEVLGNNSINFASDPDYQDPIYFPFTFAWPVRS